jgi:hypothetical protein
MVVASSLYAIAQQPPTPSRLRGTIEGVDGDELAVKSRGGEDVKLRMTGDIRVVGIIKISLADIKVGSFIGTTTVPGPDGGESAIEVHVFPEDMRGTGEGSRPFDLRPNSRFARNQPRQRRPRRTDPADVKMAPRAARTME